MGKEVSKSGRGGLPDKAEKSDADEMRGKLRT